ncbi:unnamed protein product [Durusdinium trenchii]|uniref:Uncharacterized protein n=2 Tax=Durusdinium trenchii TaxID=1381693 RepID=A0ABP0HHI1_9DINO
MRLIFLDIDGVLVTRRPCVMEEKLLQNLARVARETGAKIVLSSDWRRHPEARAEAQQVLSSLGLELIGCTPCKSPYLAQRPTEILEWKRDYLRTPGVQKLENWVAIDDRELLAEQNGRFLRGHFVQTHPLRGLTPEAADACIAILKQEQKSEPTAGSAMPGVPRSSSLEVSSTQAEEEPPAPPRPSNTRASGARVMAASHISAAQAARALRVHGNTAPAAVRLPGPGRPRGRSMGAIANRR